MNRIQRRKFIPSTWIIATKQTEAHAYYALYAIDWKRGGRLSWEGWNQLEDLLQFHIPIKRKAGGRKSSSQPAAKICEKSTPSSSERSRVRGIGAALLSVFFEEKMEDAHSNE
ncbi:hypothetical protein MKY66_23925 [Paenibacillus sp. FSL R5-0766]|uniref:hypothetical protein n=1 Tax=unclassified Paenibacillus TaxID=185978 RepID=UPI00096C78E7|nr:hypothetical protein [Paenibacillus sp. FSL R5-0765]OMF65043.1 hypothetical protein BK141_12040 [Paenibacillus sp. FSL R5-0765]